MRIESGPPGGLLDLANEHRCGVASQGGGVLFAEPMLDRPAQSPSSLMTRARRTKPSVCRVVAQVAVRLRAVDGRLDHARCCRQGLPQSGQPGYSARRAAPQLSSSRRPFRRGPLLGRRARGSACPTRSSGRPRRVERPRRALFSESRRWSVLWVDMVAEGADRALALTALPPRAVRRALAGPPADRHGRSLGIRQFARSASMR